MHNKRIVLPLGLFAGLGGFCLGVAFLFLVMIPLEAFLKKLGNSQPFIDWAMIFAMAFWVVLTCTFTLAFYYLILLREQYRRLGRYILTGLLVLDMGLLGWLTTGNSDALKAFQGGTAVESQVTFGPYPDAKKLEELKKQGYTGVITLLSTTIPFEKVLLDKETAAGDRLKLKVHSTPMLPWVSSNRSALDEIKELVAAETASGGRLYIHCYLGRHRVNLVKQLLEDNKLTGIRVSGFIFPGKVERGELIYYEQG
ncbi:MAG TPA: hypothetical protein VHS59_05075, partial [Bacillota bacterium]|nr:hypothetical protein [Bacillota bacterium]